MAESPDIRSWIVIGRSVRGASHRRAKTPNQDEIGWYPESGNGLPITLAVSDGHGSAKSFRSHIGAKMAVEAMIETGRAFLERPQGQTPDLSSVKRLAEESLPREVVHRWRRTVANHLFERPFTRGEMRRLGEQGEMSNIRPVVLDPAVAYGATVLGVIVTHSFIVYVQLGDGDILAVSETGEVGRPLPADERLFANETTSLCLRNAAKDFRVGFQVVSASPPALILVSTDGYANSFVNDDAFLKVGSDVLEIISSDGMPAVCRRLHTWLNDASKQGSGDDITLGIVSRVDATEAPLGVEPKVDNGSIRRGDGTRMDEPASTSDSEPETRMTKSGTTDAGEIVSE